MRAGLELVAAVGGLKTHAPLQARVGIATGLVVVGDLIGSCYRCRTMVATPRSIWPRNSAVRERWRRSLRNWRRYRAPILC